MKHPKLLLLPIVGAMMLASCVKQEQIDDLQNQINQLTESQIVSRIQSITYVPRYSDGKAVMSYTNNGTITAGTATFDFALKPASTAAEVAKVWQSAVSMSAVYTITKAVPSTVVLSVESVTAENGFLTVTVRGRNLKDDYFLNKCSANVCLCISDGNNDITSDYIQMESQPLIIFSDEKFKAYCVENFDINGNGEITWDEAMIVKEINCSNMRLTSLDGIECFTNLESLNCSGNDLTTLDVSTNTSLTTLDVSTNTSLTTLDVSNTSLTTLDVSNTSLTSLNISGNNSLITLKYTDGLTISGLRVGVYVDADGDKKGVIFSISKTATKIMSIDETEAEWGYYGTTTGATDWDDGVANTNKIAEGSPAAQWCRAKGSAWYFPALSELKEIYNNKATLNSKLASIGGTSLTGNAYWSSTEYSSYYAYFIYFSDGFTDHLHKSTSSRVRAVRAL